MIKYKKIPFNLELAKKITNGKIKGRIITRDGCPVRIISFDRKGAELPIVALVLSFEDYELVKIYNSNGNFSNIGEHENDLLIEAPTYYCDYSNFIPQKWQACIVRDFNYEVWAIRVCSGKDSDGGPTFFNTPSYHYWNYILPLNDITKPLVDTTMSYDELCKELDNYQNENKI